MLIRFRGILGRMLGVVRSDRAGPWYPYVFTSPEQAAEAGLVELRDD